jgi:hypothetical protein
MSIGKRMSDLEKAARVSRTKVPDREKIQVLRPGERVEERKAALIERYGSAKGVLFVRIKGMTG